MVDCCCSSMKEFLVHRFLCCGMPWVVGPGIIDGLRELIDGGGVEKYGSFAFLCGFGCG